MKRINILAGHYGSGKTNIAVNLAIEMKKQGLDTVIADLDIVNPYFRTKDSSERLASAGIELISSEYANTNVDMPAIPGEVYSLFDNKDKYAVIDLGGDDRGAYALGRYSGMIKEENDYDFIFVFNCYRPLTPDAESAMEVMHEIETACGINFTAIINNSNIGELSTEETLMESMDAVRQLSLISGLPVMCTCVENKLYDKLKNKTEDMFPLILQKKIT